MKISRRNTYSHVLYRYFTLLGSRNWEKYLKSIPDVIETWLMYITYRTDKNGRIFLLKLYLFDESWLKIGGSLLFFSRTVCCTIGGEFCYTCTTLPGQVNSEKISISVPWTETSLFMPPSPSLPCPSTVPYWKPKFFRKILRPSSLCRSQGRTSMRSESCHSFHHHAREKYHFRAKNIAYPNECPNDAHISIKPSVPTPVYG